MKIVGYIAAGLVGLFGVAMALGMAYGPKTYGEMASMEESRCLDRIRLDGWHGDPASSPELYCRLKGLSVAQKARCSDHEEAC